MLATAGLLHSVFCGFGRGGVNFDLGSVYVWVWEADLSGGSELAVLWSVRM